MCRQLNNVLKLAKAFIKKCFGQFRLMSFEDIPAILTRHTDDMLISTMETILIDWIFAQEDIENEHRRKGKKIETQF